MHFDEQCYFVLAYANEYYIWKRVGQGNLNGPTLFGRLSAFVARVSQSVLDDDTAAMQMYVDDPLITIMDGDENTARYTFNPSLARLRL